MIRLRRIHLCLLLILCIGLDGCAAPAHPTYDASSEHMIDVAATGRGTPQGVQFSPDGRWIAAATDTGVVLYDARTLTEIWHNEIGFAGPLKFAPDSARLAVAFRDTSVRLLRVADGSQAARLQLPGSGAVITFSADGTLFAAGTSNAWVRVWRVADAALLDDVGGFDTPITQIAISRDKARVVSVNGGCHLCGGSVEQHGPDKPVQIRVWQIADGALLQTITPLYQAIHLYPAGLSYDGAVLLALTSNGLETYHLPDMTLLRTLDQGKDFVLNSGVFSPDGSLFAMLVTPSVPGIRIWSLDGTVQPPRFTGRFTGPAGDPWYIALSPDHQTVAAAFRTGSLQLWPLEQADTGAASS